MSRRMAALGAVSALLLGGVLAGCSSSGTAADATSAPASAAASGSAATSTSASTSASASAEPSASAGATAWKTPQDVLDAAKAAGFDCTLPSSDTAGQVLTEDPFTGEDLAGNALVRCPEFQVMLASGSVNEGFALLVKCQTVPASIRQAPEWTVPVIVGSNFVVLPSNLSAGWAAKPQPDDVIAAFGGATSTFGEVYEASCAGAVVSDQPSAESSAASPAAS